MNRDPLGLGVMLYGFRVPAGEPVNLTLLASGWHMDGLAVREFELAHEGCAISTFCRNPLHPGPCKGWRKKLGIEAPGALKAIKSVEAEKLAKKRAATAQAKSTAGGKLTQRQLSSPLHAKKATIKHANILLGNDEAKANKKADRVILNKAEIKKYSQIKAAQVNSLREQNGLEQDPGLEDRIAEALAKDNVIGKDDNYRAALAGSASHMGVQLADKHCKKGDGDCDGKAFENLRDALTVASENALLTGDDGDLSAVLADYKSGKFDVKPAPEPEKPAPPAAPEPAAAAPALKKVAPKKAKAAPVPLEGNAAKADIGMKFGLGLMALAKGNKTLGTKAAQKAFADKIQGELDGEEKWNGVTAHGAGQVANTLVQKSDLHPFAHPTLSLSFKEKEGIKVLAAAEIEQGLKGEPGPFPVVEALKKAVTAWHAKDNKAMDEASAELLTEVKTATAKKVGADPNAPGHIVAAHVLFKSGMNYADDKAGVRLSVLNMMTAEEFGDLPLEQREEIKKWLEKRATVFDSGMDPAMNDSEYHIAVGLQQKLGLPEHEPKGKPAQPATSNPAAVSSPVAPGGEPTSIVSTSPDAKKASNYALGVVSGTAKQKLATYEKVSGPEFQALTPTEQKAILDDLEIIQGKFLDPKKAGAAKAHKTYLSGYTGGGSGAGGPLDATSAPALTDQTKAQMGANALAEMTDAIGDGISDPDLAKTSGSQLLNDAAKNGAYQTVLGPLANMQASVAMDALSSKHVDAGGSPLFEGAAIAMIKPELSKDIYKKLNGDVGPTPVYDAWLKAMKSGSEDDAQGLADAAFPPFGGTFGGPSPGAPLGQKATLKIALASTWEQAGFGTMPAHAPEPSDLDDLVDDATGEGWLGPAHLSWAKDFGSAQAHTMVDQAVVKELGLGSGAEASFPPGALADLTQILSEDFNDKLITGDAGGGTGAADDFATAVAKVKAEAAKTAAANGWNDTSSAVQDFKRSLIQAEMEKIVAKYGTPSGAGAGGGSNPGTAHVPGVPHTAASPAPPAKPFAPAPVGSGSGVGHLSTAKQASILEDFKGFSAGKFLSDPKEPTYGNLLALASVHGTADEPLSVMQILQAVDNSLSAKLGVTNTNLWEKEFTAWLQTPEGSKFAADNPTPDANLVKKLSGVYDGITTDLGELSKKVKLLPGPGQFDENKPSSDFQFTNASTAYKWKAQMLADQGGQFTPSQLAGIQVYTGSSFSSMNSWLRGLSPSLGQHLKDAVIQAQDAMRPLPKDTLLIRGTGWDALPEGFRSPAGAQKLIGQTVMDEAFMSTSVGDTPGYGSGKPLWLEIEAPKGTHAAFVEGKGVSVNAGEREMLLAAGQSYRILGVEQKSGRTHVRVRIVTESA